MFQRTESVNWILLFVISLLSEARALGDSPHAITLGNGLHNGVASVGTEQPDVVYGPGDAYLEEACRESCTSGSGYFTALWPQWSAGIEFTLLKPHFENNVAFTTLNSDGDTFEAFTDTEFAYDRELAPRVWIEASDSQSLGMRAIYWQFDHPAATATGTPPANGFGRITPPSFGDVDLSTSDSDSQLITNSEMNAYSIDLEVTKRMAWGRCGVLTSFGLRYAEIEQRYDALLLDGDNETLGTINYSHQSEGIGPTIAVRTQRPFTNRLAVFGLARGSLLFGDGQSLLTSIEDQNLDDQLITNRMTVRNDLLPIGELQLGLQWTPKACGVFLPYLHVAMEGQLWSGVGNASSEDGNMGFFGFNVALGVDF